MVIQIGQSFNVMTSIQVALGAISYVVLVINHDLQLQGSVPGTFLQYIVPKHSLTAHCVDLIRHQSNSHKYPKNTLRLAISRSYSNTTNLIYLRKTHKISRLLYFFSAHKIPSTKKRIKETTKPAAPICTLSS